MFDWIYQTYYFLIDVLSQSNILYIFLLFFPFVIIVELPFYIIVIVSALKRWTSKNFSSTHYRPYYPLVTIAVMAYKEHIGVIETIRSAYEQLYNGKLEIIIIIDDALNNLRTVQAAEMYIHDNPPPKNMTVKIISKRSRGGLAQSRNTALRFARGEIFITLDADTIIENVCVDRAARHFSNKNLIALSGALRVKNNTENFITKLQSIEYKLSVELNRYGLAGLHVLNNISGAFGIFRTKFLKTMHGWMNGTAEDLDMTMRIHTYAKRYPNLKIEYEPEAVALTNCPTTLGELIKQRMRWEGDLYYIYIRRHWRSFSGKMMGRWKAFVTVWYGIYYQIITPFIIVLYYIYLSVTLNVGALFGVTILIYLYYLIAFFIFYSLYIFTLSPQVKKDIKLMQYIFVIPLVQLIYRILTMLFILNEIVFKEHQYTTMAPWWIIKRTK